MLNLLFILISIAAVAVAQYQYCATVDPSTASGADGTFAMEIYQGQAQYSFTLDMSNFVGYDCDYSKGLAFHIHSYWKNSTVSSSALSFCAASYTGGHYDPNFACSQYSQNYTNACPALDRVSPSYTYSCNADAYAQGEYSLCEVGDLSGKYGLIYPKSSSNPFFTLDLFTDSLPPYVYNYKREDLNSLMWSTVIFHCAADNTRLVCADISDTKTVPCAIQYTSFSSADDDNNDDSNKKFTGADLAVAIVVCTVVAAAMGLAAGYALLVYKKREDQQHLNSSV